VQGVEEKGGGRGDRVDGKRRSAKLCPDNECFKYISYRRSVTVPASQARRRRSAATSLSSLSILLSICF
jgi:hypothetical protein